MSGVSIALSHFFLQGKYINMTAVKINIVVWVVTLVELCSLVGRCQHYRRTYYSCLQGRNVIQNVGNNVPDYMVS